jgi:hypothetical protein
MRGGGAPDLRLPPMASCEVRTAEKDRKRAKAMQATQRRREQHVKMTRHTQAPPTSHAESLKALNDKQQDTKKRHAIAEASDHAGGLDLKEPTFWMIVSRRGHAFAGSA